jgi:hypothetical protein
VAGNGMYLQLSDLSCVAKSAATTPVFYLYLSPDDLDDTAQDGDDTDSPYEYFYNALTKAYELAAPYTEATVYIYFQTGDHYLLNKDYGLITPTLTDENSQSMNLVLMPEPCIGTNADTCVTDGDQVTLYNKIGGNLEIPVLRSLTITDIIIDSVDSIISVNDDPLGCLSNKEVCC